MLPAFAPGPAAPGASLVVGVIGISALIWVAIIQSTLNKLFFKLDVSRHQLQKAWDL